MNRARANSQTLMRERRGNAWSGAVAMVLLGLFAVALISSEMDADRATDGANPSVPPLIAGQ
ncbi:MAG: hypothetical protein AAFN07_00465 [Pseudomonadota bacterium]